MAACQVFIDYRNLYKHKTDKEELMFKRTATDYSALPNGWQLYRKLLAAQPDHSVSICSIELLLSAKHCNNLIGRQPALSPTKGMSGKFKSAKNAVRRDFWKSTALRVEKDSFLTQKAVLFRPRSCPSLF